MNDQKSALLKELREADPSDEERFDSAFERVEEIIRKVKPYVTPLRLSRRSTAGAWRPELPAPVVGRPSKKR